MIPATISLPQALASVSCQEQKGGEDATSHPSGFDSTTSPLCCMLVLIDPSLLDLFWYSELEDRPGEAKSFR